MRNQFYSIRQGADRLGVAFYRIKYSHQDGHVQEPLRVANTRFYEEADILQLQDYFATKRSDSETRVFIRDLLLQSG